MTEEKGSAPGPRPRGAVQKAPGEWKSYTESKDLLAARDQILAGASQTTPMTSLGLGSLINHLTGFYNNGQKQLQENAGSEFLQESKKDVAAILRQVRQCIEGLESYKRHQTTNIGPMFLSGHREEALRNHIKECFSQFETPPKDNPKTPINFQALLTEQARYDRSIATLWEQPSLKDATYEELYNVLEHIHDQRKQNSEDRGSIRVVGGAGLFGAGILAIIGLALQTQNPLAAKSLVGDCFLLAAVVLVCAVGYWSISAMCRSDPDPNNTDTIVQLVQESRTAASNTHAPGA